LHVNKSCFLLFLLLSILLIPLSASADFGPKPRLTVIVTNPPEEEYYLDLLIDYDAPLYDNIEDTRDLLDAEKLSLLENHGISGWYAALTHGTKASLWGKLTGERREGDAVHSFGYMGVPDKYKIIIITPENKVTVTRTINKVSYVSTVYYDYETGEETGLTLAWIYVKQFLMSLLPTLILEGAVLLLFRFKTALTLGVFLSVNLITQAGMTLVMSTSLLKLGLLASYVVLLPVELVIIAAEVTAFAFLLTEGTRKKRIAYAITANIVSAAAMFLLLAMEYSVLVG